MKKPKKTCGCITTTIPSNHGNFSRTDYCSKHGKKPEELTQSPKGYWVRKKTAKVVKAWGFVGDNGRLSIEVFKSRYCAEQECGLEEGSKNVVRVEIREVKK